MSALEKATRLVDFWSSDCAYLSPQDRGIRLIELIAELVEQTEREACDRGRKEGHGGQANQKEVTR